MCFNRKMQRLREEPQQLQLMGFPYSPLNKDSILTIPLDYIYIYIYLFIYLFITNNKQSKGALVSYKNVKGGFHKSCLRLLQRTVCVCVYMWVGLRPSNPCARFPLGKDPISMSQGNLKLTK